MTNPAPKSVLVAGMHRSGTSFTASLMAALGVDVGSRLVSADRSNAAGFFEDADIVSFHGRVFQKLLRPEGKSEPAGHIDWGWNGTTAVDSRELEPWTSEATQLVERRNAANRLWGFKDPRATLVLDFWNARMPAPVYVAVYRAPHRVADSMQRLGADVFLRYPEYAWTLWTLYNRRLLEFFRQHRDRCLLVEIDALTQDPDRLPELLRERLALPVQQVNLSDLFREQLLQKDSDFGCFEAQCRIAWEATYAVYDALQQEADLPRPVQPSGPPATTRPIDVTAADKSARDCVVEERAAEPQAAEERAAGERVSAPRVSAVPPAHDIELSILMPTYNDATLLVEALASAERCSQGRHEILIGDDGSDDAESLRILDCLSRAGHTVLHFPNAGLSATRNRLAERSRGRFLLPLDADNRLLPGFIEQALDAFRDDPGLGVVYGDRRLFGQLVGDLQVAELNPQHLLHWNEIDACALMRREVWQEAGGYDTRLFGLEDWELWMHASKLGWRFRHLPRVTFEYRVRPGSLLERCGSRASVRRLHELMLDKHGDLLAEQLPSLLRRCLPARSVWLRMATSVYWKLAWTIPPRTYVVRRKQLYAALSELKTQVAPKHRTES